MPIDPLNSLVDALRRTRLLGPTQLDALTPDVLRRFPKPRGLAGELIRRGWLTPFQANLLLQERGGELLLGSYILLARLGEGGMGQVFKARNRKLGRTVALKLIRKDHLSGPHSVRRFQREIRAVAQLSHPNIVLAYDADEVNGTHFFVMEYVPGQDLARLVKEHGPLPVAQACEVIRQAALGLQHAFERGLVHRDLKPRNILLTHDGVVKILDLGLARLSHGEEAGEASGTMTREGEVMGTPDYMAPEQTLDAHQVDVRADLYSLGCTLYFLLTGLVPFPGGGLGQKLARHQVQEPVPVEERRPEVPPEVAAVVRKLMAKRPEDRYQTPDELAVALADLSGGLMCAPGAGGVGPAVAAETVNNAFDFEGTEETVAQTLTAQRPPRTWGRRHLLLFAALAGGLTLLVLTGLSLALRPWSRPPESGAETKGPWQPGPAVDLLPGVVARPAALPGLRRWQVETHAPRGEVTAVAWSPDGKLIAYGDRSKGVRLLEASTHRLVRLLPDHEGGVRALAWSPDGQWLAAGGADRTVRLWRPDGKAGPVLRGHKAAVFSLAWSPDSKRLASGGYWGDPAVRLWGVNGTPGPVLVQDSLVHCLAWSPDGTTLASTDSVPFLIRLRNAADGAPLATLGPLPTPATALAWSPDSKRLASSGGDYEGEKVAGWVWDVATRQRQVTFPSRGSWTNWLGWNSEGQLAATTQDGYVVLLDAGSGKVLASTPQTTALVSASWSWDRRQLADSAGRIWDVLPGGKELRSSWAPERTWVSSVAWAPDGKGLATGGRLDKTVRLWQADGTPGPILKGHEGGVFSVSWSPDGSQLASAAGDRTVRLWGADGTPGPVFRGHEWGSVSVAWSPDGQRLASAGGFEKTVRLWQADGTPGPVLRGPEGEVTSVAWAPDGKRLAGAVAGAEKTVRLWDADGTPGPILKGHTGGVRAVAWSPDGTRLATAGGEDNTVRLWEADGTPGPVLKGHEGGVHAVAWGPDGTRLASTGEDGTVRLWGADGTPGLVLRGHEATVLSVASSPDGNRLASAGTDSTVRVTAADGNPEWTAVVLPGGHAAVFSAAGELLHGDPAAIEKELVYVVEPYQDRVELLTPAEFRERLSKPGKAQGR